MASLHPGNYPYGGYNAARTLDMEPMPDLTHSAMSAGTDNMDLDSRPLEDHQIRIQHYGLELQADQQQRIQQQRIAEQKLREQQYQQHHHQHQQQQQQQHQYQYQYQYQNVHYGQQQQQYPPYSAQTEKQQEQLYQYYQHQQHQQQEQEQQKQKENGNQYNEGMVPMGSSGETDMPSLSFSTGDHSTSSSAFPSASPALPKGLFPVAEAVAGAEGSDPDHEYFLTSVLDMIAPGSENGSAPPMAHYDYLTEFTQRQRVTKGGNGEIRRAYWPTKRCYVILKSLIGTKHTPVKIASLFDKEVQVMRMCGNHDNLVQFYGVATRQEDDQIERFMVMHYYEHGDLVRLLEKPKGQHDAPTLTDKLFLALDIALGLEHLFRCGFHHGDLHPKNILIDNRQSSSLPQAHRGLWGRYQARLTDFGLRRIRDNKNLVSSQQFGGVWQFMAPERMCKDRPRYNIACDIFALGVIYWFIMAGRYPFRDPSKYFPGAREERVVDTPDWYYDVYTQAWQEHPSNRQKDFADIIHVFREQLGIPAPTESNSPIGSPRTSTTASHLHPESAYQPYSYATPSFAHHGPNSPSMSTLDGGHQHVYPSGSGSFQRGGSSRMSPTLVAQSPYQGAAQIGTHMPSPLPTSPSSSSSGGSTIRSTNPNHPRNRKVSVPNGMPGRPGYR
ncbi:hypothetical protein BGX28_002778 [Mortierella sp. GBA30]|nr:hypothetical protein BGX28_002778 [Mortierella sp. GBA30]